jgi:hypothetical protein
VTKVVGCLCAVFTCAASSGNREPLLQSNNVNTVATFIRFGMISKSVFDTLGVVPDFISSYDARKYSFPELMSVRKFKKMELH